MLLTNIAGLIYSIDTNPIISSIKKGLILLMPILLIGMIAVMLRNFPLAFLQEWFNGSGQFLSTLLIFLYNATAGFLSVYLVLSVSYYYVRTFNTNDFAFIVLAMLTSLMCFIASFGGIEFLSFTAFGAPGVFTALICTILGTRLFIIFYKLFIKYFPFHIVVANVDYRTALFALVPMFFCVLIFSLLNRALFIIFDVHNFNELINLGLRQLFLLIENNFVAACLYIFILNLLWFFGIHGGNVLDSIGQTIFTGDNVAGPFTKSLLDTFTAMGGSGSTICFLFALYIIAKSKDNRQLAYIATPTMIFNINEILVFGFPIILNPIMIVPFIFVPFIALSIVYLALVLGLIPLELHAISWTTPIFFSGYLLTETLWGPILQAIILIIGTLIYIPFIQITEGVAKLREKEIIAKMWGIYSESLIKGQEYLFLQGNDSNITTVAKAMASNLRYDCNMNTITLHYQPQVDSNNQVIGAEALLRWRYKGEIIPPPLIIAIAREDNCFKLLTNTIIDITCQEIIKLKKSTRDDIKISVNISAAELADKDFISYVVDIVDKYDIKGNLCLEITEETTLVFHETTFQNVQELHNGGILLAVDDFSMGQTSLKYLQNADFNFVKLDGALVKGVLHSPKTLEIIKSITNLGNTLGFSVIAEYVETEDMKNVLLEAGCSYLQGYLFSPAIPMGKFIQFYDTYCTENKRNKLMQDLNPF